MRTPVFITVGKVVTTLTALMSTHTLVWGETCAPIFTAVGTGALRGHDAK